MDPDAALAKIRQIVAKVNKDRTTHIAQAFDVMDPDDLTELIELVDGLDQWITKGGFLPKAWLERRTSAIK